MSRRTPLARALGAGSAKDGTGHWWAQRVSAVALVPLVLWLALSVASLAVGGADYLTAIDWVRVPMNAVLLLLVISAIFYHSHLGVQVVIEDYVHGAFLKVAALILQKLIHLALAVAGIFAVLRIALGE